jgi:hypothetical protein
LGRKVNRLLDHLSSLEKEELRDRQTHGQQGARAVQHIFKFN